MFGTAIRKLFKIQTPAQVDDITILYGSHSGNSAYIAKQAQKFLKKNGQVARVANLAKYDVKNLANEKSVLIIISTHGEGDPPDTAQKFYLNLFADDAPDLSELQFSVCALGDSSYEQFCKTGRDIDARLEALGGSRFHERVDCDVEFQKAAAGWIAGVLSAYSGAENDANQSVEMDEDDSSVIFHASVKSNQLLNKGSDSETYHVELTVDDPDFSYQAGDSLSIVPENDPDLVKDLLLQMNMDENASVPFWGKELTLKNLLLKEVEITTLSKGLLQRYQQVTGNERLKQMLENESELQHYIHEHDVLDLVTEFPFSGRADEFAGVLRKIQPRLYSISSASSKTSNEVHLTIKLVQYQKKGRMRSGACSSYLSNWLEEGQKVNLSVVPNELFRFPEDDSPVIMIAAGTGIAPFRAFMKEDEQKGIRRKSWLFFGEKYREHDFFYEKEWEHFLNEESLTRISLAFSRDQQEKVYVQHKIEEQSAHLYRWLKAGAHLYICGAIAMGKDTRQAIVNVVQNEGDFSEEAANEYWNDLVRDGRVHEDVY